ncbi:SDR family oxidoreductase [Nostoc sp.]|uniref:SDR family oxidoreductase n=1 Tax=Nostoc sp. TaxID=1180 RepID=UPI003FA5DF28
MLFFFYHKLPHSLTCRHFRGFCIPSRLKTQANVYCLVRSIDAESGKIRLQNNLELYGIWHDDFADRIIPVLGDLSQPLLEVV